MNSINKCDKRVRGITLISLVVAIVVLLILAGVSISMLTGENSIIKQSVKAKEETDKANEFEQVNLAVISAKIYNNGVLKTENLRSELAKENEAGTLYGNGYWIWKDRLNCYIIDNDGNVKIKNLANKLENLSTEKLTLDGSYVLNANGKLENGEIADNSCYIWQSSNPNVATVSDTGIVICGKELGTAVISCISRDKTLNCEITTTAKIVSEIKEQNGTINNKSSSHQNPTIPNGFRAINTAKSTWDLVKNNQSDIDKGLVIMDLNGNQFVWIPVENVIADSEEQASINKAMAIKIENDYRGLLYEFYNENLLSYSKIIEGCSTFNDAIKEPSVTSDENINNSLQEVNLTFEQFEEDLQLDYNDMIKSVIKYGGFWVARFETGYNKEKVTSIAGVVPTTAKDDVTCRWYGLYKTLKSFSSNSSYKSSMIYGSQYDAIMNWMIRTGRDVITPNKNIQNKTLTTGIYSDLDVCNNIYDLYGCRREWTIECNGRLRTIRGGIYYGNMGLSSRTGDGPTGKNGEVSSRLTLCLCDN